MLNILLMSCMHARNNFATNSNTFEYIEYAHIYGVSVCSIYRIRMLRYMLRDNWRCYFHFLWCFILINSFQKSNFLQINWTKSTNTNTYARSLHNVPFVTPNFRCDKNLNCIHITIVLSVLDSSWLLHLIFHTIFAHLLLWRSNNYCCYCCCHFLWLRW